MFVRVAFRPGYPEAAAGNLRFSEIAKSGDAMTHDHPATQVHATLEPRAEDLLGRHPPGAGNHDRRVDPDALDRPFAA
jgi:hypothetical protein